MNENILFTITEADIHKLLVSKQLEGRMNEKQYANFLNESSQYLKDNQMTSVILEGFIDDYFRMYHL